jgi:AcrR family transcriptional regulator
MAELMRVQGYAATGVNQLAKAAGAPTGSIYHHFKGGKREVAAAALRQTGAAYIQLLPLLLDPHDDLVTGIEAAFTAAGDTMQNTGWANMCPVGTVTGEVADAEPELRAVAAEVISDWVNQITRYLTARGLPQTDAQPAAYAILTALEGAFLLARALRSTDPFQSAGRMVANHIASITPAAQQQAARP